MSRFGIFFVIKIVLALSLLAFLFVPLTSLAPLGDILNPYTGIWRPTHNDFENLPPEMKLKLQKAVRVEFESTGIPHIFAQNDADLYFVQGYLEARDRLWAMDFVSRVAGGRLSEVFGKKTLNIDETFVQLRLPEAAEQSLKLMLSDPQTKEASESFSNGVNFYIEGLTQEEMPLEFKIFHYRPENWSPFKTALLEKFMSFSLAGFSRDLPMSRNQQILSEEDYQNLFPEEYLYSESIISNDHKWNFKSPLPPRTNKKFRASLQNQKLKVEPNPSNGSNNWAVFGKKSSTGFPILSNDIHLDFSLPSLWYQVQLVSPTQNIYGISLAGAPGVIIGFSKKLAWAVTNASSDFMDWYELKYKDGSHHEYLFGDEYRKVEEHKHTIVVRGAEPVEESLKATHFGPIVFDKETAADIKMIPHGLALRWTVLDPSNELKNLLALNHGQSVKDCDDALKDFGAPSQNFICADIDKNVKMGIRGNYPLRYKGQGKTVSDGSDPNEQWGRRLTPEELPYELNPARNFVFSANQKSTNESYPAYLGQYYESPFRAQRIHQLLTEKEIFTPQEIRDMQKDTLSKLAEKTVPILLQELKKQKLSTREEQAIGELSKWDFKYEKASVGASIYDSLWQSLEKNIWSPFFPDNSNYSYPTPFTTSELIKTNLNSKWLNSQHEKFADIVHRSLIQAIENLEKLHGSDITQWNWEQENLAQFDHLSRLPLFSMTIPTAGDRYSILAIRKRHGPAWKMVVSLGPDFKAWGIYPGGQSGDVRSPHAREFLNDWSESKLRELQYLEVPSEKSFKQVNFTQAGSK